MNALGLLMNLAIAHCMLPAEVSVPALHRSWHNDSSVTQASVIQ